MQIIPILFEINHSGRTLPLSFDPSSPLSSLLATLEQELSVLTSTAKLLSKGKKLQWDDPETITIEQFFERNKLSASEGKPLKLLLIGPRSDALHALQETERVREKKRAAFQHHQAQSQFSKPVSTPRIHSLGDEDEGNYKFWELEPFPKSVPCYEKRLAMLKRLSKDEAVLDVMKRHKFAVGVLTELHPILQPTLLGLNTNAGEKVSLRLLTDDLEGTRNYNEVRRVLLHELSHNRFGDHDDDFKALNSQLNKEVASFESSPYFEPWSPSTTSSSESTKESHRLNEVEAERVWEKLQFGLEEEVEMKRERVGNAAEERMKRELREKGKRS
ncbi:uncharacterized protein JCM6883_001890 [Sporobolomyces salmoneus]|uniref:uncharacterized protein n=1 Tax=Sporobolomyces salmoneus TaxID=183962 RepID=UPI00316B5E66